MTPVNAVEALKEYIRMRVRGRVVRGRVVHKRKRSVEAAFGKFTGRARSVLQLAQEEAQRLNHSYLGTEHILLGLIREGDGIAGSVFRNLGIELQKARSAVESTVGTGERPVLGEIGLTPEAKRVIRGAVDEAKRLRHHYVGTEHLLLALVLESDGIGARVLSSLGLSKNEVRTAVEEELRTLRK